LLFYTGILFAVFDLNLYSEKYERMKIAVKIMVMGLPVMLDSFLASAQCSICTKTASQLGEEAGRGLNGGILYLAAAPLLIVGYIGYRWYKNNL
jgi:uncharacterized membrane protein